MRLFRAPFLGDAEPTTADELVPIKIAQSMGYVTVGLHVDPKTFNITKGSPKTDPSAELVKLAAQEVKAGAIIFRNGDKLYLVDTDAKGDKSYLYSGWAAEAFSGAGQP